VDTFGEHCVQSHPVAGGIITCGIAGEALAFEAMQDSNMVESLLGVIAGNQAAASAPLFNRFLSRAFLSSANDMLSEDGLAMMPVDATELLERVASELGLSMEVLRRILKETSLRMEEGGKCGGPPVTVEVLSEDGDDEEDREVASNSTANLNSGDLKVLEDRFEGATVHEQLSDAVSGASENASPSDAACNSIRVVVPREDGRSDEQDIYQ
jgi:hypothetical protein